MVTIQVLIHYYNLLLSILEKHPTINSHINTHMHMFEYIKHSLSQKEKNNFLENLKEYRSSKIPLSEIKTTLYNLAKLYKKRSFKKQTYFNPFPVISCVG